MSRRLKAAGLFDVPTWVFLILLVLVGLCGGMLMMELFGNEVVYGIVGFGLAMYLLYVLVRELGRSRARRFEERLVDAVGFMASMASTDGNPVRVLKHAAEVSRKNVRVELREVVRRLGVGMPIYQALSRLVERYDSESVRVFANALASKWQAGGDMVPMMQSVSRLMHERLKHRMQLKSQLGGAQVTSIAAGAMPYLLLLVFMRIYPEWVDRLVSHPVGLGLLFATICLQIVGVLWLQRLTHVEY